MADPAPAAPEAKGPNPLIIAIAVAVLMLVGTGAIVYFLLPGILEKSLKNAIAQSGGAGGDGAPAEAPAPASGGGEAKGGEGGAAKEAPDFFEVADLLVNVSGTKGSRFLKVTAHFEGSNTAVIAELEKKQAKIRDMVSGILGQKSLDELSDPGIRGKLRSEILGLINPILETKGEVVNVYFPQFIIQ